MPAIKDQAIALRKLDYSETSQVLLFLTRDHGPRRLLAKGIKRGTKSKFATGIDLLERGQLEFSARSAGDSSLGILIEWRQIDLYVNLRTDLSRLYAAQYAAEVTAAMLEEADPHADLFDALTALLRALAEGGEPLPLLVKYQAALLTGVGLWPDLTRCLLCERQAPPGRAAFFSAHQGGLICRDCVNRVAEKQKVNGTVLEALRRGQFSAQTAPGGFDLLDYTFAHTLGRRPHLSRFIRNGIQ
jgi:DNA repair protein RecO (recombination protein O)